MKISRRILIGGAAALVVLTVAPAAPTLATDDAGSSSSSSSSISSDTTQLSSVSSEVSTSSAESSITAADTNASSSSTSAPTSESSSSVVSTDQITVDVCTSAETDPLFSIALTAAPTSTSSFQTQLDALKSRLDKEGIPIPAEGSLADIDAMTFDQLEAELRATADKIKEYLSAPGPSFLGKYYPYCVALWYLNDRFSGKPVPPSSVDVVKANLSKLYYIFRLMGKKYTPVPKPACDPPVYWGSCASQ